MSRRTTNRSLHVERMLLPACVGVALVVVWHFAVIATRTRVFPSPEAVLHAMRELARSGTLVRYTQDSLRRVGGGYAMGILVGVPVGLWMGRSRTANAALDPLVQLLRPISPIAWIPLSIVFFGVGNAATMFLIFLATVFPISMATTGAVRTIPVIFTRVGVNFGLSPAALFSRVIVPAILPKLVEALRLALGIAWLVVVAGEMVAVDSGLGYMILDARNAGKRYDLVVGGMIFIGIVGLLLDSILRALARTRALQWGTRAR